MTDQTKLTVVLWDDRRTDTSVSVFTNRDAAEQWARARGHEYDRHGNYAEKTYPDGELAITYSCENDRLRVFDVTVDAEVQR